jgi:triosephosphate isomerase
MKLVVCNWKMNPAGETEAADLARKTDYENFVICPPWKFLKTVAPLLKRARLGVQDFSFPEALTSVGAQYVIIGHSDRRMMGETDEMVAKKVFYASSGGLIPILCVGETWEQKQAGEKEKIISQEIKIGLSLISKSYVPNPIYIAYEPIWAISTSGRNEGPDTPENTLEAIELIKPLLNQKAAFLYGGSVNADNAADFLKNDAISGVLVGKASLDPEAMAIIRTISQL